MTDIDIVIKELAEAEGPCPCRECTEVGLGIHSPACDECRGTGKVALHEWIQLRCGGHMTWLNPEEEAYCYTNHVRPRTLSEIDLESALESLILMYPDSLYITFTHVDGNWRVVIDGSGGRINAVGKGDTPTEAAVRAIHAAMEEKVR